MRYRASDRQDGEPDRRGELWEALAGRLADRLTLYLSLSDLRREHAAIGQSLSWESLASQVAATVAERPALRRARRLVVSVGYGGAAIFARDERPILVFDPRHQEDDWHLLRPGVPAGLGSSIVAALGLACAANPGEPDVAAAVTAGLRGARLFHERGLEATGAGEAPRTPIEAIAAELEGGPGDEFERAEIPPDPNWRIFAAASPAEFRGLAERIAIEGEGAARGIPIERWAMDLDRPDRNREHAQRAHIIREYLAPGRRTRPLNIAVFGPPGSGNRSRSSRWRSAWTAGGSRVSILEFNLSQFAGPADLTAALQRVRDGAVEAMLPLVFWDEFDAKTGRSDSAGWPIPGADAGRRLSSSGGDPARSGGRSSSSPAAPTRRWRASCRGGRGARREGDRLPRRLRGFVDVFGPNPAGAGDDTASLRRALLLRSLLRAKAPRLFGGERLEIDPGVLRAFLGSTPTCMGRARWSRSST